jgi:hypothetical protein
MAAVASVEGVADAGVESEAALTPLPPRGSVAASAYSAGRELDVAHATISAAASTVGHRSAAPTARGPTVALMKLLRMSMVLRRGDVLDEQ